MRLWPTCDKKALKKHLREYIKVQDTYRYGRVAMYKYGILTRLILAIREEIKYYDSQ